MASSSAAGEPISATGAQRPAGRLERVQTLPAAADEEFLGHGEMQEADLIGDAGKPINEIGEHAIDTSAVGVQLLMPVGRKQQLSRGCGQLGARLQEVAGARVGEIEMQPQPPFRGGGNRLIDRRVPGPCHRHRSETPR